MESISPKKIFYFALCILTFNGSHSLVAKLTAGAFITAKTRSGRLVRIFPDTKKNMVLVKTTSLVLFSESTFHFYNPTTNVTEKKKNLKHSPKKVPKSLQRSPHHRGLDYGISAKEMGYALEYSSWQLGRAKKGAKFIKGEGEWLSAREDFAYFCRSLLLIFSRAGGGNLTESYPSAISGEWPNELGWLSLEWKCWVMVYQITELRLLRSRVYIERTLKKKSLPVLGLSPHYSFRVYK